MIRRHLALTFVAFHLLAVVNFVYVKAEAYLFSPAGDVLRLYNNVTGIFRDYSYFAPSVAGAVRVGFLIHGRDERTTFVPFAADHREADYRLHAIALACMRNARTRQVFAQSWAARMLGRHADATSVTVMVELLNLPPMIDYRQGTPLKWETIYAGTYERSAVARSL
jgi:hypothetical protein